jgi:hypothetical protein
VHGFAGFPAGLLQETRPDHVAVVFDASLNPPFRNDLYPDYTTNREDTPEALRRLTGIVVGPELSLAIRDARRRRVHTAALASTCADPGIRATRRRIC